MIEPLRDLRNGAGMRRDVCFPDIPRYQTLSRIPYERFVGIQSLIFSNGFKLKLSSERGQSVIRMSSPKSAKNQ